VPLLSIDEIRGRKDLKKDFDIPQALVKSYNDYWAHCRIGLSGEVSMLARQHTRQYLQWRGGMLLASQNMKTRGFFQRANGKDQKELANADNDLVAQVRKLHAASQASSAAVAEPYGGARRMSVNPVQRSLLADLDKHADLPDAVRVFFDDYIHDSRAGFTDIPRSCLEPSDVTGGYLRYRNIYQSTRSVEKTASVDNDVGSEVGDSSGRTPSILA